MDISVFDACMEHYNLNGLNTCNNACTYAMTGEKLTVCCKTHRIPFNEHDHHDALADADACAKLYMVLNGVKPKRQPPGPIFGTSKGRAIAKETTRRLSLDEVENKSTIFYGKKVVITGAFEEYPERDALAKQLQALGAKVNQSISKCTNIVIEGIGAGPKKMETVENLQAQGYDIQVLYEEDEQQILECASFYSTILVT